MHFYYEIHFKECRSTQVKIKIEYGNTVCIRPDTFSKLCEGTRRNFLTEVSLWHRHWHFMILPGSTDVSRGACVAKPTFVYTY